MNKLGSLTKNTLAEEFPPGLGLRSRLFKGQRFLFLNI